MRLGFATLGCPGAPLDEVLALAQGNKFTGVINEPMKSPSSDEGSHSLLRLFQVASSISTPSGVAWISLNSPIWRWNATFGSDSLKS